jgi:hypothetical protein
MADRTVEIVAEIAGSLHAAALRAAARRAKADAISIAQPAATDAANTEMAAEDRLIEGDAPAVEAQVSDDEFSTEAELAVTTLYVRSIVAALCELTRKPVPIWGNQTQNVEAFRRLRGHLDAARKTLAEMPDAARILLVAPEVTADEALDCIPSLAEQQRGLARLKRIAATLTWLRVRCNDLAVASPGVHGNAAHRRSWQQTQRCKCCAITASTQTRSPNCFSIRPACSLPP